jgi:hypothetical protein
MPFKPRPKQPRTKRPSHDATLVRGVFTSPGVLPSTQPEGSPFRWTEIVSGGMKLESSGDASRLPYLKIRLARGLRQMKATGEVEQVSRGMYRLRPQALSAPDLLAVLATRMDYLSRALTALPSGLNLKLAENEWYFLRDRFKDLALAVERELTRAGVTLELPTTVRVIEGSDGQPANRHLEVRFRTLMIEGADSTIRAMAESASDGRFPALSTARIEQAQTFFGPPPPGTKPTTEPSTGGSGLSARPAIRSRQTRTPSRRRAASAHPRRARPVRAA